MTVLRAFIAIEIPNQIQDALEKQITRLRQSLGDELVRWVPTQNIHLTLKFIGNIAASHVRFFMQLLTQAAELHTQFDLQVASIGSFPNSRQPRILWVGIQSSSDLISLQKSIESGATRLGYEKDERPFAPHLTLGRVRQNINEVSLQKISSIIDKIQLGNIGSARVDSIHLYQSEPQTCGSVYTKLFSVPLKKLR